MTSEIFGNTVEKNEFFLFLTGEKKELIGIKHFYGLWGTQVQVTETRTAQLYRYFSRKKKKDGSLLPADGDTAPL